MATSVILLCSAALLAAAPLALAEVETACSSTVMEQAFDGQGEATEWTTWTEEDAAWALRGNNNDLVFGGYADETGNNYTVTSVNTTVTSAFATRFFFTRLLPCFQLSVL